VRTAEAGVIVVPFWLRKGKRAGANGRRSR
jgi:hypothetical protein